MTVLDLMSSWRSHIPENAEPKKLIGLGMNAREMAENPQLDDFVVHDLNKKIRMPFDDNSFDMVICTVSVEYLMNPGAIRGYRPGSQTRRHADPHLFQSVVPPPKPSGCGPGCMNLNAWDLFWIIFCCQANSVTWLPFPRAVGIGRKPTSITRTCSNQTPCLRCGGKKIHDLGSAFGSIISFWLSI